MALLRKEMCVFQMFPPPASSHKKEGCGMCSVCTVSPSNNRCKCFKKMVVEVLEEPDGKHSPAMMAITN